MQRPTYVAVRLAIPAVVETDKTEPKRHEQLSDSNPSGEHHTPSVNGPNVTGSGLRHRLGALQQMGDLRLLLTTSTAFVPVDARLQPDTAEALLDIVLQKSWKGAWL